MTWRKKGFIPRPAAFITRDISLNEFSTYDSGSVMLTFWWDAYMDAGLALRSIPPRDPEGYHYGRLAEAIPITWMVV